MSTYRVEVRLEGVAMPDEAVGLLFPVPPTTADQELIDMSFPPTWETRRISTVDGRQCAVLAKFTPKDQHHPVSMDIQLRTGPVIEAHFEDRDSESTDPREDARMLFGSLGLENVADERVRLRRIVNCISEKFVYKHDYRSDEPLTCDLLTGNCLDINAALMMLLRLADIKHAYYIGYFLEEGQSKAGRHCWVSTMSQTGYECWDIAHHLKRDISRVEAGLNPIAGQRFAMSTGWDPVFEIGKTKIEMPHLATPRWVFKDGSTMDYKVPASVSRLEAVETGEQSDQCRCIAR